MFNRQLKTVTTNTVEGSSSSSSSSTVTRSFFTTSTTYHSSSNSVQTLKCTENAAVRDAIKRIDQLSIVQPSDKVIFRKDEHCPSKRITSEELLATKSNESDKFHLDCLNAHNDYRRRHGVGPLKLSPTLSNFAQNWANTIAKKRQLQHSSERKYGENIYWSSGKTINGTDPVDSWYSEIKQYNYKNATFSSGTGHFTQVVWKGSLELGVGVARVGNEVYVVASYYPPGNFSGEFSKNLSIVQPSDKVIFRKDEHCPSKRITSEELPATKSNESDKFHLDCLNAHNDYRRRHGVGPLKLSPTLSNFAQNWANTIAKKRQLQHSSERKYGENIYWSSGKTINGTDPVDSWYSEIKQYNYKNATFSSGTGHFTQVVWKGSLELGVGVARVGNESCFAIETTQCWLHNGNFPDNKGFEEIFLL
ncbi:hypothetical protein HA402_002761 [Bradysia odoriphaga]|nr:hypothetical protein HA402_002761 [Bradysia odoriphaga]